MSSSAPRFGGGDKCGRCGKTVYSNEKVIAAGSVRLKRHTHTNMTVGIKKKMDLLLFVYSHGIREGVSAALSVIRALSRPR